MSNKREKGFGVVLIVILVALIIIVGVGYFVYRANSDDKSSASNQTTNVEPLSDKPVTEEAKATGTTITTGDSEFGAMLFDDNGQAIYIWELEETAEAECYGDCAELWPPVLTDGAPQATGEVNGALLGTTTRTDGTTQVTYNGHPLYYYAHEGPGEVECHNIRTHGGLWWVIHPSGNRAA